MPLTLYSSRLPEDAYTRARAYIKGESVVLASKQLNRTSQFKAVFIPRGNSRGRAHGTAGEMGIGKEGELIPCPFASRKNLTHDHRARPASSREEFRIKSLPARPGRALACGEGPEFRSATARAPGIL